MFSLQEKPQSKSTHLMTGAFKKEKEILIATKIIGTEGLEPPPTLDISQLLCLLSYALIIGDRSA